MVTIKATIPILVISGLLFQGCAPMGWQHPIKGQTEFSSNKYECERNAARLYPPIITVEQIASGYRTPTQTNCRKIGNEVQCTTYGGDYIPPVMSTVDVNERNRGSIFDSCMQSLGWEWKRVESNTSQRAYR